MDLAKLHSPNRQKQKKNSKTLIFKITEQKNDETGKHYFIKNVVLHFQQIRHSLERCRKKGVFYFDYRNHNCHKGLRKLPLIHCNQFP